MVRLRSDRYSIAIGGTGNTYTHMNNRLTPRDGSVIPALFLHGASGDFNDVLVGGFAPLALAGVPVVGINTGANTFGNATAMTNIDTAVSAVLTYYGWNPASDKVVFVGGSMGSTNALNWAVRNPTRVQCICQYLLVSDLDDVVANDRGGFAAAVNAAHGGSVPDNRNPNDFAATTVSGLSTNYQATGIPTRFYYSTSDPIGVQARTLAFDAACSNVEVVSYGAVGHTTSGFPTSEAAEWVVAQLP